MNRLRMIRVVRKLSAEELQANSLKRLERLTKNTPMAPKTDGIATGRLSGDMLAQELRHKIATLTEALMSLRNEIAAMLGIGRQGIEEAVGVTNIRCLIRRIDQADAALAAVRREP